MSVQYDGTSGVDILTHLLNAYFVAENTEADPEADFEFIGDVGFDGYIDLGAGNDKFYYNPARNRVEDPEPTPEIILGADDDTLYIDDFFSVDEDIHTIIDWGRTIYGGNGVDLVSFAGSPHAIRLGYAFSLGSGENESWGRDTIDMVTAWSPDSSEVYLFNVAGFEGVKGSHFDDVLLPIAYQTNLQIMEAGSFNEIIYGLGGNDDITGSSLNDALYGDGEDDGAEPLLSGGNSSSGVDGNDTIYGSYGDDMIVGGGGNDFIDGGGDTDTAVFSGNADAYSATYDANTDQFTITGTDGTDTVTRVEFFQFDDVTFTSSELVEELIALSGVELAGSSQNDALIGTIGDDTFFGSSGNDTMSGLAGHDRFEFDLGSNSGNTAILDLDVGDEVFFHPNGNFNWNDGLSMWDEANNRFVNDGLTVTLDDYYDWNWSNFLIAEPADGAWIKYTVASMPTLSDLNAALYLASHSDLIDAYGYDLDNARSHYEVHGKGEGRAIDFDATQYLANYADLQAAFGSDLFQAASHFITHGYGEGRTDELLKTAENTINNLTDLMTATASQSSTHSAHAAMETFAGEDAFRVIDNDVTTHNHTNVRNGANSVTIDLNGDAFIEEIAIENGAWNARAANRFVDATVKVLKDGVVVWHNVDDGNTTLTQEQYQTLIVEGDVVGDQILIENDTYIHLKEVDVFGNLNLTDVMNVTASSSSTHGNNEVLYGAANVLDGDTTTFNHTHRDDRSAPTLEINLGAAALIETVVLSNRNDGDPGHQAQVNARLTGARLEIFDDGILVGPAITLTGDVDQTIDTGGVVGDTIRITNEDEYLHIAEIDVYGDLFV